MESETCTISKTSSRTEKSLDSRILVVDDDTTCLSIVAAMLKKLRYEVVTVKHPNDALCTLRIKGGAFDLVISDVHMPDMNGFELQKVIAQEFNLPVVLMSADNEEGVVLKGLQNGAAFFILKPVSADDLRDLWQFASMNYNKKTQVLVKENTLVDEISDSSSSSVHYEDGTIKKDSKRKSPRKEGSCDEKRGEVSESSSQKKPKVVWTNALHNRFLEAIRSIGFDRAVPKKIVEVMNVPGLSRENVASHLQKYRIFLRRVSDAGYKIHYAADNCFNRSCRSILTSSRTNPSILMLNNFINNKHRNPGQFPGTNNGIFFRNREASSSSSTTHGIERSGILSHSGRFLRPNLTNSSLLIQNTDLSRPSFAQSNNLSAPSCLEDISGSLPSCFHTSSLSPAGFNIPSLSYGDSPRQEFSVLTNDTVSTNYMPSNSFAYQANYVGLRMSNLKQLTESSLSKTNQGVKPCSGVVTLPGSEFEGNILYAADQDFPNDDTCLDRLLQPIGDSTCFSPDANGGKQLSDVIADYQMLISPLNLLGLISGMENGEEIQESVFAPDLLTFDHTMSSEQSLEEGGFRTSLTDELHFENQGQQNGGNCTINSLDFNASSQFSTTLLSPSEREDQEFLASLLASDQFRVEQTTLDGMYLH